MEKRIYLNRVMSLKDNNRKLNQTNEKIGSGESSLGCKTRVMVKKKKKKTANKNE